MFLALALAAGAGAQQNPAPPTEVAGIPVNYDEAKTGTYKLPDLKLTDAKTWNEKRRPELVRLFEENQYGKAPKPLPESHFVTFEAATPAFEGKALRKQGTVFFSGDEKGPKVDVLIYLPPEAKDHPVPLLLNVSFTANSSAVDDPGVKPGEVWGRDKKRVPAPKGGFGRLNVLPIVAKGFGVATVYYGDIDPDFLGGATLGVRGLYLKPGQTEPAPDEWGSIAAWGFGLSRVLDYLSTDPQINAQKVALMGVSRIGKTVLWTAARDPRFALVIASCSGEGGAALSHRNYGETIAHLTAPTRYPYQFAGNYGKWANRADEFPIDAHMLLALIAPRPVLLQTGTTDGWSDPKGEFLAAVAAAPAFELLGAKALGTSTMPEAGQPILNTLGYYEHIGGHGTIPSDWDVFLKFMEMHLKK
jgi:hypothetical protein